jgi:type VI secretion system protein ImpM
MSESSSFLEMGFYGKLPTYGDFIQKRLPQDFVNPWHQWLQTGMLAAREKEPENWLNYYLNCPAWCFVLSGGICGSQAVAGVTIPSVDKVGRYFNFTLACMLPEDVEPVVFAAAQQAWFADVESLALVVLDEDMDQQEMENNINSRSLELSYTAGFQTSFNSDSDRLRVVYPQSVSIAEQIPGMLHKLILREHDQYGLWWHQGSSQVSSQSVICAAMPAASTYIELLMDEDLPPSNQSTPESAEVDYLDELLSS